MDFLPSWHGRNIFLSLVPTSICLVWNRTQRLCLNEEIQPNSYLDIIHGLYTDLVNHPIHPYASVSMDETSTDTKFASSFQTWLNGSKCRQTLLWTVWALSSSHTLKVLYSASDRKILNMLHWYYLTSGDYFYRTWHFRSFLKAAKMLLWHTG